MYAAQQSGDMAIKMEDHPGKQHHPAYNCPKAAVRLCHLNQFLTRYISIVLRMAAIASAEL